MQWFKKQNLYKKILIMSLILIVFCYTMITFILWDLLASLSEIQIHHFLLQSGVGMLLAMLFAERLAVKIAGPLNYWADETAQISDTQLGLKVDAPHNNEKDKLAVVFNTLVSNLLELRADKSRMIDEFRGKGKWRDTLINKLIMVQEEERKRISRELHDEVGQALTTMMVSMRILSDGAQDERQRQILLGARELAADTLNSIRILAVNLRPPVIDDLGLVPAMKKYIADFRNLHLIQVDFNTTGANIDIASHTAITLYRIMQESLINVVKHSKAQQVRVDIEIRKNHISLRIEDDGKGFSSEDLNKKRRENRLGVYGMEERVQLLGGTFQMKSEVGEGTRIMVIVPNEGG
jgi:signal transduction histidine kinase